MDTSDPAIEFDEAGHCSHCNNALKSSGQIWHPENGEKELDAMFRKIKQEGEDNEYDCAIGLSGGVDSSYLAYITVKKGLRPLVVHVDCGWNSEEAVRNIENIVKKLDLELHTVVVNWEEMKDLQRSFFKAGVPDQDIPQDHAIFAALYEFASRNNVRYVLNGYNFATESIMPVTWGHQAMDYRHIMSIHRLFGEQKLKEFPLLNFFQRYIWFTIIKRMKILSPLNYIDYRKDAAIEVMKKELDWQYYGGKHCESRFTKFFQSYYLPVKFNIDKRKGHLSSLIIAGQISRDEALRKLAEPLYTGETMIEDLEYVAKKLGWTPAEFRLILEQPPHSHNDYPTNDFLFSAGIRFRDKLKKPFKQDAEK